LAIFKGPAMITDDQEGRPSMSRHRRNRYICHRPHF
jgi:hypothetical protein